MIFGICTGFEKTEQGFTVPHLAFIKRMGFDYLELPLNGIAALSGAAFAGLKNDLAAASLPVLVCNCFMDGRIPLTGPDADPEQYGAYIQKAVFRAAQLGVKKLVLGSGASRNVPPGFSKAKAEVQLLAAIDSIVLEMVKYGMELELEHLNRGESNILTSFAETARIVREKNCLGLKSILDTYHFSLGNEDRGLITKEATAIGHVHYARTLGRTFPALADMEEEAALLGEIKASGYDGTFSMECSFPRMGEEPQEYAAVLEAFRALV